MINSELTRVDQERRRAIRSQFKNNINNANHARARTELEKNRWLPDYKHRLREAQLKKIDNKQGSPRQILGLELDSDDFKKIGSWFYSVSEEIEYVYNYYSEDWHKKHGGKAVCHRSVMFGRIHKNKIETRRLSIANFKAGFVLRAAKKLNLFEDVKNSKYSLKIRSDRIFDAELISTSAEYKIYKRTLEKVFYDYVIVSGDGVVYRDSNCEQLKYYLATKKQI